MQRWDFQENPIDRPEIDRLADQHWQYIGTLIEYVYKTAFIHGAKHQKELTEKKKP